MIVKNLSNSFFPYSKNKKGNGIGQKSNKKELVKDEVYNEVYNRDKGKCRLMDITCNGGLELHHIVYRSEDKNLINEPTNCILLCNTHHRLVHSNKNLWKPILQDKVKERIK